MKNLLSFRNGQIRNYIAVLVFLFIFGFASMFGMIILRNTTDAFKGTNYYNGTTAEVVGNQYLNAFRIFDYIIILVMISLIIGIGVTSYKLATAPVFFIVSIIMAAFLGFMGYFFSYIFVRVVSQQVFQSIIFAFPRTIVICTNLHWVGLLVFVVGSITLYAKRERGGFVEGGGEGLE